jgi:hypothetical protein
MHAVPPQCLEDGHLDALAAQGHRERNGSRALEETIEMSFQADQASVYQA